MKKLCLLIIALALLLSACVGPFTPGEESTPPHSDTSPSFDSSKHTDPTETISTPTEKDYTPTYLTDLQYYKRISVEVGDYLISGWALVSCPTDVEYAVIPSHIDDVPVVAIGKTQNVFGPDHSVGKIAMPDTVQYIGSFAFANCTTLTDLTLSSQIKFIGGWAFENCPGLKELRITPDMQLSYESLLRATGLTRVIIEEGATLVPFFTGCSSLKEIQLPSTITEMGMDGSDGNEPHFAGTQITFIELPEDLTYLGWYVFQGCNIESIILPSTLTQSYSDTFDTESLKYVFFRGAEDQLLDEVRETIHAPIYFYSEKEPAEEGNFWRYVDGKPVIW